MLADAVKEAIAKGVKDEELFSKANLWSYQVRFFRDFGAEHLAVDNLKRWMLVAPSSDLDWFMRKDIINNSDLRVISAGKLLKLTAGAIVKKVMKAGPAGVGKLLTVNTVLMRSNKLYSVGKKIPGTYNEEACARWAGKIEGIFASVK
jgi:hypothetical protein